MLYVIVDELTDAKLFELSSHITRKSVLRKLSLALDIPLCDADKVLLENPLDIDEAAYDLLKTWRMSQPSHKYAYYAMLKALEEANMQHFIEALK